MAIAAWKDIVAAFESTARAELCELRIAEFHDGRVKQFVWQLDHDAVEIAGSRLPAPIVSYPGERQWRLEADYEYRDGATTIAVPSGFRFDLSSVPRLFWPLIAPFELSIAAPLVHDFLYRHAGRPPDGSVAPPRTYTRAEVDQMFRAIMEAEAVPAWRRILAYLAVRSFGRTAWRD
ncbi:MAG: DUF1353 domain-containing protein [Gaiellaceae bacterium]